MAPLKFDQLNDQGPLPIERISGLIKFNSLKFTFQYVSNIEELCKMRYTCNSKA